jgi:hypothetical protein
MGMIVSANHRNISVPAGVKRQERRKCIYINAYAHKIANPTVFYICMYIHFYFYQYNRYQKEIQEKNEKIRILEK